MLLLVQWFLFFIYFLHIVYIHAHVHMLATFQYNSSIGKGVRIHYVLLFNIL